MATSAAMQCTPILNSNSARFRPAQATSSMACVKPVGFERCGLGLGQSVGYLRDRRGEGSSRRVLRFRGGRGIVKAIATKGQKQVAGEGDSDQRVDPVGFLKEKSLKTKAFQTFTRERFLYP